MRVQTLNYLYVHVECVEVQVSTFEYGISTKKTPCHQTQGANFTMN